MYLGLWLKPLWTPARSRPRAERGCILTDFRPIRRACPDVPALPPELTETVDCRCLPTSFRLAPRRLDHGGQLASGSCRGCRGVEVDARVTRAPIAPRLGPRSGLLRWSSHAWHGGWRAHSGRRGQRRRRQMQGGKSLRGELAPRCAYEAAERGPSAAQPEPSAGQR